MLTATVTMKAVKGIPSTKKSVFTTLPPALNFSVLSVRVAQPACYSMLLTALLTAPSTSPMLTAQAPLLRRRVAVLHGAQLPPAASSVSYAQPA